MILTGKAVKYAEDFELFEKELQKQFPDYKPEELNEDEQIELFKIIQMFHRDSVFKNFMCGCSELFNMKMIEGKEAVNEMLTKFMKI